MDLEKLKALLALKEKYGSGMGDVQKADAEDRSLPIMKQGYGSPEKDQMAESMKIGDENIDPKSVNDIMAARNSVMNLPGSIDDTAASRVISPEEIAQVEKLLGQKEGWKQFMKSIRNYNGGTQPPPNYSKPIDFSKIQDLLKK